MSTEAQNTIASRFYKINKLILGKSTSNIPSKYLVHRDGLLDLLFALYEECNGDHLRKDKHIASFVNRFKTIISELRSLRVNSKDFEAKQIIGRGHFGEVQVVREKGTGDVYAMKVLKKQETLSHQNIAFYEEERDIMAKSTSPWITKLQYAFQDNQFLYLIMEFHPGGDMLSLLEKYDNVLPEQMAQFYLSELILAIHSVHLMGYAHRDIKPDNILIDRTGHIKLADFGSAAKLNAQKQVTSTMPVGTPDYVAPEVLDAMNTVVLTKSSYPVLTKTYSVECDWWSLGILAYEMLFGSTPFANEKLMVTYNNIMSFKNSLKFPDEASEVSETFIDLIKGLLQDSSSRLGYDELIAHALFADIDWNNLRHTVPPFVPNVASVDDTSNFDEFEPENRHCLGGEIDSKKFCGKNLPFVGFTYTSPVETIADRFSSSYNSASSPLYYSADSDVFSRKNEVLDLQSKLSDMSAVDGELKNKIDELEASLQSRLKEIEEFKTQKETLECLVDEQKSEIKEVKRLLGYERKHREISEQKASQIVHCMKVNQRQEALKLKSRYSGCSRKEELRQTNIENSLEEALLKQEQLSKEKSDLEKELQDVKNAMQESEKKKTMAEKEYNGLLRLVKKVETKNIELENEISRNAIKFEMEDQTKSDQIKEFEKKLQNEQEKIAKFESQIKELKQELDDYSASKISSDSSVKRYIDKQREQKEENETLKNLCDSLRSELKLMKENVEKEQYQVLSKNIPKKHDRSTGTETLSIYSKTSNDNSKVGLEGLPLKVTSQREKENNKENQSDINKQLKEKEDTISDISLKLRVSERKKQQAEDITSALRESNRTLREKLAAAEKTSDKMIVTETQLREKLENLEQEVSAKQKEIQDKETLFKIEKAKLEERIKTVQASCENSKDIFHQFSKSQGQYEEITRHSELLKKEIEKKTASFLELEGQFKTLKQDLFKKQNECTKYEKIVKILKETSQEMEDELKELEDIIEARDKTIAEFKKENIEIKKQLENFEGDLKHVNSCLHNEKNLREELEEQVNEIAVEMENQQTLNDAELQSLQEHLEYYKKLAEDLESQIAALEKELSSEDRTLKKQSEKNAALESQLMDIKEETAKYITQISSLKASNLKLNQALDNAIVNQHEAQQTIDILHSDFETEKINHAYEKVKLQETVAQQTKLIDFLQSKAENMEKRKKNNISRLFGKKDTAPPSTFSAQFKDMENILEKEKTRCRRLQDQLSQARAENMSLRRDVNKLSSTPSSMTEIPVSPASRAMHTVITSSPCPKEDFLSPATKYVKPQGMKHKIPHRFNEVMCMKSSKCCACLDSIHFGRLLAKCDECSVVCHPKCATSLPSTCGLPSGFMQHFKTVIRENSSSFASDVSEDKISEGWVKLPKSTKQGWERRYLRFIGDILYVFEHSDESNLEKNIELFDFKSENVKIIITSAVSATELTYAASSDLPYVLKVEYIPRTTCWPRRCLYIMAPNFGDKQMWVSTLEESVSRNVSKIDVITEKQKLIGQPVLTLKGDNRIDTHCIFAFNDNIMVLGAVEGLYLLFANEEEYSLQSKIEGISSVYQIGRIKNIDLVVLIEGVDRRLKVIQEDIFKADVQNLCVPSTHLKSFNDVNHCHLFSTNEADTKDSPYLCSATYNAVTLYKWDPKINFFSSQKVIETRESCSCIHFTPHSIIFGSDKFYEVDIKTYAVEDFLDSSDSSLAGLIYGASQFESFPVAILQVASKNQEEEYLICFHELGVFVDGFGQRTRSDDLKWSKLPLSFAYRAPFLFVTHFSSLEVIEISPQDTLSNNTQSLLPISNPQYLGPARVSGAIYISSSTSQSIEILLVNGKLEECKNLQKVYSSEGSSISISCSSLTQSSTVESGELDFSFSTSVNQSLDDLSDTMLSKTSEES